MLEDSEAAIGCRCCSDERTALPELYRRTSERCALMLNCHADNSRAASVVDDYCFKRLCEVDRVVALYNDATLLLTNVTFLGDADRIGARAKTVEADVTAVGRGTRRNECTVL